VRPHCPFFRLLFKLNLAVHLHKYTYKSRKKIPNIKKELCKFMPIIQSELFNFQRNRDAVTCLKAKRLIVFFVVPVDVSRKVGAAHKTAYENDRATKRDRYSEIFPLFRCLIICLHPSADALRDKFRPIRYFFCASSLCSASD